MIVTFCGHSDVYEMDQVREWLLTQIERTILIGADEFLLGGYGAFDNMAAGVVRGLKAQYPHIQATLVLPYLDQKVDAAGYDGTVYPPLETVPKRYAIVHRNRWMVEKADVVIAYVTHSWGGAAETLRHAKRRKKTIILFNEHQT